MVLEMVQIIFDQETKRNRRIVPHAAGGVQACLRNSLHYFA
jgi:hypothetical protein